MSSCLATAVERHTSAVVGGWRHCTNFHVCLSCKHSSCLLLASCSSSSFKCIFCFAGEYQSWPDFILAAQYNACRLKETIHFYIWHCLDICVCVCSHCIFMCATIPDGYGPQIWPHPWSKSENSTKPGVSASKPSFCHLPGIQMA